MLKTLIRPSTNSATNDSGSVSNSSKVLTAIKSPFHKNKPQELILGFLLAMYIAMGDYSLTVSAKVVSTSAAGVAASVTASDSDSRLVLITSQRPQLDV